MIRIYRPACAALAALLVGITAACSNGDDGGPVANPGSILVTASPAALAVEQGAVATSGVTVTRAGGFSAGVDLSITGLPTGITATITPTQLSGGTKTAAITLTVAAAVPAGIYSATITGSAPGISAATTTLALTVMARPASSTDVAYEYCDEQPIFFAYQDGDGAWQAVAPGGSGVTAVYRFRLTRGYGGVIAVSRATATTFTSEVRYASARELAQDGAELCGHAETGKTVNATVNGVGTGQYGVLSLGAANEVFVGGTSKNPVQFSNVPTGALDFVAARITSPGLPPDRVVVFRNLDIPSGGSLPAPVDFNGPASSSPSSANATIQGGLNDALEVFSEVVTARGGRSLLWFELSPSVVANRRWAGLAPTTMIAGDFHSVVVFATPATEGDYRVALKYVGQVSDQTLTLGPKIGAPTMSAVASGPYPRLRFQGDLPQEYDKGVEILLGNAEAGNTFSIAATAAYFAAMGDVRRYTVVMPDVRGLETFPDASRAAAGPNDVLVSAFGFTGPGIFDLTANLGSEYRAATKAASVVVP